MIVAYLVVFYAVCVLILAGIAFYLMFYPRCQDSEYTRAYGLEKGEYDSAFLELPWKEFQVASPFGYMIAGNYLEAGETSPVGLASAAGDQQGSTGSAGRAPAADAGPRNHAPTALFVHGITWTRYGMYKYMRAFHKNGWNVVAIDLAGHGKTRTPRKYVPSFGYYEKYDIGAAVDYARSVFPDTPLLGLVGESLGAASALQYAEIAAQKIQFVIADCSFSRADKELEFQLRKLGLSKIVWVPAAKLVSLLVRVTRGFWLDRASPERAVLSSDVPMLFIHGIEDRYVPTWMSIHLYNLRKKAGVADAELLLMPGARHAKSYMTDPAAWEAAVFGFIAKHAPGDRDGTV